MNILFVHGWGTDVRLWYPIARLLPEHQIYFLDFGFLHSLSITNNDNFETDLQMKTIHPNWRWIKHKFGSDHAPPIPQPFIAIGHSMGVAWILKNLATTLLGLISIAGFARFAYSDNLSTLNKMKIGLERKPVLQMKSFWRSANIPIYQEESGNLQPDAGVHKYIDVINLLEGLEFLSNCNEIYRLNELNCNVRALASRDDKIVSKVTTNSQWTPEQLRWANSGGHGLPLSEVDWCYNDINSFLEELRLN